MQSLEFFSCAESTFEHPAELPVKSNEPEYFSVLDGFHGQVGKREIVQVSVA